jgi:hypothetical protein
MINIAVRAAEQQILSGRASSQLLTHYLKLGTAKERLEKQKLEAEVELLKAKKESLESAKQLEILYGDAIKAIAEYTGHSDDDEDIEDYYE